MRKRLWAALVLVLVLLAVLAGCSWRRDNLAFTAVYTIDADLDPDAWTMTYTERASVTNTGADSTCV